MIEKWFFVRYFDPKPHIRLRFKIAKKIDISLVLKLVYNILKCDLQEQLIASIKIDTYEREIERYGSQTIDLSETLFGLDSETTLGFLSYNENLAEDKRWLYGLFCIDAFLNAFGYKVEDKIRLLNALHSSFRKEFSINDDFNQDLNVKFKKHAKEIESIMNLDTTEESIALIVQFVNDKRLVIEPVAKIIIEILNDDVSRRDALISSYIHMFYNRLFISDQRLYELVLYGFYLKLVVK